MLMAMVLPANVESTTGIADGRGPKGDAGQEITRVKPPLELEVDTFGYLNRVIGNHDSWSTVLPSAPSMETRQSELTISKQQLTLEWPHVCVRKHANRTFILRAKILEDV